MKRTWGVCLAAAAMLGLASRAALAANEAVAPFVDAQTDAIIHADLSAINLDALMAIEQKAIDQSNVTPAQRAQANQALQQQLPAAKQWISNFTKAGGKDLYVVISIRGLMAQQPGEIVVPLAPGADADALAKLFKPEDPAGANGAGPNGAAAPSRTATAVIGRNLVFCTPPELPKLQNAVSGANAAAPVVHSDLLDAIQAGGNSTVQIAVGASGLQIAATQLGALAGLQPAPQLANVAWAGLNLSLPPTTSFDLTLNCTSPDAAAGIAAQLGQKIDQMRTDPNAQAQLGDKATELANALKPVMSGTRVTISLRQQTIDSILPVIMQNAAKNAAPQSSPRSGSTPPPGQPMPVPGN